MQIRINNFLPVLYVVLMNRTLYDEAMRLHIKMQGDSDGISRKKCASFREPNNPPPRYNVKWLPGWLLFSLHIIFLQMFRVLPDIALHIFHTQKTFPEKRKKERRNTHRILEIQSKHHRNPFRSIYR